MSKRRRLTYFNGVQLYLIENRCRETDCQNVRRTFETTNLQSVRGEPVRGEPVHRSGKIQGRFETRRAKKIVHTHTDGTITWHWNDWKDRRGR